MSKEASNIDQVSAYYFARLLDLELQNQDLEKAGIIEECVK